MRKGVIVMELWLLAGLAPAGCLSEIIPAHERPAQATPTSQMDAAPPGSPDDGGVTPPASDAAPITDGATAFSLTIEAETAILTAPMAVMTDPNASGGQYIACPAASVGGKAVFTFSVPHDGKYAIWGRVIGPTANNNSFHVSIDTDTITNVVTNGISTIWDLPVTTTWMMSRVNMRTVDTPQTDVDQTYTLTAGSHTLYLNEREDSSQLDRVVITDDLVTTPN
jgi:hypothetical protein